MTKRRGGGFAALLGIVLLAPAGAALGGEEGAGPKIDPKANAALRRFCEFYGKLKSFRVNVSVTLNMETQGRKIEETQKCRITTQRPNRFSLRIEEGPPTRLLSTIQLVSDGEKLYTYWPMGPQKKYTAQKAPADFDALFADKLTRMATRSNMVNLLVQSDPYEALMKDSREGLLGMVDAGIQEFEDVRCRVVRFLAKNAALEFWLQEGEQPLLRRIVITSSEPGRATMSMAVAYRDWSVDGELPADAFAFTPPEGAKLVKSFFEKPPHPLLGKPAPDFTVALLGGGEASLAAHKGKHIVVLDFWATLCPPCRKVLPILVEVTGAYRDKGVVFYAVNEGDKAERIRAYLEKAKLSPAVALDADSTVGRKYAVRGIPQTVIIGRDGTVEAVHIGLLPDLKARLMKEFNTLLAGGKLVD